MFKKALASVLNKTTRFGVARILANTLSLGNFKDFARPRFLKKRQSSSVRHGSPQVARRKPLIFVLAAVVILLAFVFINQIYSNKRLEKRVDTVATESRADAYTNVGTDLKQELKPRDAERAFKLAIELDPKGQEQAYLGLAELYRFYMPEKDGESPGILRSGILYEPQDIILLRALAQYYERTGDIGQARHWYGKIVDYYPGDVPAKRKIEELGG